MGDVMVHKLSPLHHIVSVKFTGSINIRNNVDTHKTSRGKRGSGLGNLGSPDSITVLGKKGSLKWGIGSSPSGFEKIVTRPIIGSVSVSWITRS